MYVMDWVLRDALSDILEYEPWNYVYNCGTLCPPGCTRIETVTGPDAPRITAGKQLGAVPSRTQSDTSG